MENVIKVNVYLVSTKGLRAEWGEELTAENCPRNGQFMLLSQEEYDKLKEAEETLADLKSRSQDE